MRALTVAERRERETSDGCRVVACVDVETLNEGADEELSPEDFLSIAIHRIERCIRPGDRMCMLGHSRVALFMGNGSDAIAPAVLGRRLARALGDHLSVGNAEIDLGVAIGIGAAPGDTDPGVLAAAAMASVMATRRHHRKLLEDPPTRCMAVTHLPDPARGHIGGIHRRVLVPLVGDSVESETLPELATEGSSRSVNLVPSVAGRPVRVLLVDPTPEQRRSPGPVVEAVGAILHTSGFETATVQGTDPEQLLLEIKVAEPDTAVVVLQSEPLRLPGSTTRTWEAAAQLTRLLHEKGVPVVALSMGASVAALAACVEQGAAVAFDPESLAPELGRVLSYSASVGGHGRQPVPGHLPQPYDALVHLTPSERRVLFHMMDGRSAIEIASTLVVSVTTIRSHIRSILHKLNVNSQLAAVALAFGTTFEHASAG